MGNIADLLTIKDDNIKSNEIWGLPYGKSDIATADKFLKTIVQWLSADENVGIMSELDEDIKFFFRQTPMEAAYGVGFAKSFLGFTKPWLMPKILPGEEYKDIKPPLIPVFEEKIKEELKLQCSVAISTQQGMEHYVDKAHRDKLISMITATIRSAINNTITEFFNLFWNQLMFGYSFDNPTLLFYNLKETEADDGKAKGLLKKYQEDMDTFAQIVKKEANKFKNYVWYDSMAFANYTNKNDNLYTVLEAKKPANANDQKTLLKSMYTDNVKRTYLSREQSLYALLTMIKKAIGDLVKRKTASPENHIQYDPSTGIAANAQMGPCKCKPEDLCIVISAWDAIDLEGEILIDAKTGRRTMSLKEATGGMGRTIVVDGLPPGFAYVGSKEILNFILSLDHSGMKEHLREEEQQGITNYWLYFGSFTKIAGKVLAPARNYNPGGAFFTRYGKKINEA